MEHDSNKTQINGKTPENTFPISNQPKGEALWRSIGGNFSHFA